MDSNDIRRQFLDFFRSKQHEIVPSSPVVPLDDPTLMFTNAGMNQFKDVFLGAGTRPYKRAADTQKCIRAGGKHNDLDDVGKDTYHHTFFEMLGNWSFGDYFKKEAIEWAWELLTKVWGIPKDRLHATYFGGLNRQSAIDNRQSPQWELEPDYEARDLWPSVTDIDPTHIHPGSMKDNFWEMGDTGPCGPCSEIHIDLTPDKSGRDLVNKGDARVMEIWNLVFIQFNRAADGSLSALPARHVDTGMGFERLCAVLQGLAQKRLGQVTNYDTDVFRPIFADIQKRTSAPDYAGTLPSEPQASACATPPVSGTSSSEPQALACATPPVSGTSPSEPQALACATQPPSEPQASACATPPAAKPSADAPWPAASRGLKPAAQGQVMVDVSYRVIADHIRTLTFAITDGALPSNEGRGYVLRRILRRAVRFGRQYLNMHEPFLCDLVAPLVEHMGDAFPELRSAHGGKNVQHVADVIRDEEASFLKTLDRGIKLFEEAAAYAVEHHHGRIKGEDAFKLHDTYGFPIDLTEQMAEERGLTIDVGEYARLMDDARDKARGTKSLGGDELDALADWQSKQGTAAVITNDGEKYTALSTSAKLLHILRPVASDEQSKDLCEQLAEVGENRGVALVLDRTCFYAEQGGQVGDAGTITCNGTEFTVTNTYRNGDTVFHIGHVSKGRLRQGDQVQLAVDARRLPTMLNHTATHLLNWALREVLCPPEEREQPHVQQKGSLVDPDKTRFDFSHGKPLADDELAKIESLVNEKIREDLPVYTQEVEQAAARQINTLRAVFGEKYPETVRVVSIGADIDEMLAEPKNPEWMKYSVEFCGGTHVASTKEIDEFVLTSEEAVAKGIRRVVGITGVTARKAKAIGAELTKEADELLELLSAATTAEPPAARAAGDAAAPEPGAVGAPSNRQSTIDNRQSAVPSVDELTATVSAFQQRVAEAVIPIRRAHHLRSKIAEMQRLLKDLHKAHAAASGDAVHERVAGLLERASEVKGVTIVVGEVPTAPVDSLRTAVDWVRQKTTASAVLLAMVDDGKVTLLAGMSKDVVSRDVKAGDLIKEVAPLVGGKGGGRPDMAQGGGTDPAGLVQALARAEEWLTARLTG